MTLTNRILEYAAVHQEFGVEELVREYGEKCRNTLTCILSRMVKAGALTRKSRGVYALPKRNAVFQVLVTEQEKTIVALIKKIVAEAHQPR